MQVTDKIQITNEDNMLLMARYPDKYFDLAIVDPPYGIGAGVSKTGGASKHNSMSRLKANTHIYNDIKPNKEYFNELQRVSKNQIIWGGNYFINFLSSTRCFVVWDKMNYLPSMSQIEIAWTSFNKHSELVKINSNQENRFHISQKPADLYKWLLDKYAKENDKILDTHLGSGSIAIACHDYGFDLTACELDKEYFDKAIQRINNHTAQTKLF
jgi:site-specific DNA-methyltransferase (adenine-specific)